MERTSRSADQAERRESVVLAVMVLVFLLLVLVCGGEGYKIRRTDCRLDGERSEVMVCTCGGLGDPYSIIMNKVSQNEEKILIQFSFSLYNHLPENKFLFLIRYTIWNNIHLIRFSENKNIF